MSEWRDVTTFSRGDTERVPQSWKLDRGGLSLTVLRNHLDYRGSETPWVLHCEPWFRTYNLPHIRRDDIEGAQGGAELLVMAKVKMLADAWLAGVPK